MLDRGSCEGDIVGSHLAACLFLPKLPRQGYAIAAQPYNGRKRLEFNVPLNVVSFRARKACELTAISRSQSSSIFLFSTLRGQPKHVIIVLDRPEEICF
jgi:hypothetical protein